jgi:hypothetical protein
MTVERDTALADRDLGQGRTYLAVEAIPVYAQVGRGIAISDKARRDHLCVQWKGFSRRTAIADAWCPELVISKSSTGAVQGIRTKAPHCRRPTKLSLVRFLGTGCGSIEPQAATDFDQALWSSPR